jgi:hypothetical protein
VSRYSSHQYPNIKNVKVLSSCFALYDLAFNYEVVDFETDETRLATLGNCKTKQNMEEERWVTVLNFANFTDFPSDSDEKEKENPEAADEDV